LHLLGYILEYICDVRTHERQIKRLQVAIAKGRTTWVRRDNNKPHKKLQEIVAGDKVKVEGRTKEFIIFR